MIFTCQTCGAEYKALPSKAGRFCPAHRSVGRPPKSRPDPGQPAHSDLERLVIRQARVLAVELGTRCLDLFTGPRADWARSVVTERVRRVSDVGTPSVCAAVNAVLVAQGVAGMIDHSDAVGFPVAGFAPLPRVVEVVCRVFGIDEEELCGLDRSQTLRLARSAVIELGREFSCASAAELRKTLGRLGVGGLSKQSGKAKTGAYLAAVQRARVVLREGAG